MSSQVILVYGQPASGKTYSLRNLDPKSTVIIDADTKGALPWRGWKKNFNAQNKNFFQIDDAKTILRTIESIGSTEGKYSHVKVLAIDGLNTVMTIAELFHPDQSYSKWTDLGKTFFNLINRAKMQRDDLTVIFNAHVQEADPNTQNAVATVKTPGKMLSRIGVESLLLYVLYAKHEGGEYYFEVNPDSSSARMPEGLLPAKVPNDIAAVIAEIEKFNMGE